MKKIYVSALIACLGLVGAFAAYSIFAGIDKNNDTANVNIAVDDIMNEMIQKHRQNSGFGRPGLIGKDPLMGPPMGNINSGSGQFIGPMMDDRTNLSGMEQRFNRFQDLAEKKHLQLKMLEERLDQIIFLANKVGYDLEKLKAYKKEIQVFKTEYIKLGPQGPIIIDEFVERRDDFQNRNDEMREMGMKINEEFLELQKFLEMEFLEEE